MTKQGKTVLGVSVVTLLLAAGVTYLIIRKSRTNKARAELQEKGYECGPCDKGKMTCLKDGEDAGMVVPCGRVLKS